MNNSQTTRLREALQERAKANDARRQRGLQIIAGCDTEDDAIREARSSIDKIEQLSKSLAGTLPAITEKPLFKRLESQDGPEVVAISSVPQIRRRARIGDNRYRMLHALMAHGSLSHDQMVSVTVLDAKQIKSQMTDDIREGVVMQGDGGLLRLTQTGLDLMARFEEYRRANNIALPTLEYSNMNSQTERDNYCRPASENHGGIA